MKITPDRSFGSFSGGKRTRDTTEPPVHIRLQRSSAQKTVLPFPHYNFM